VSDFDAIFDRASICVVVISKCGKLFNQHISVKRKWSTYFSVHLTLKTTGLFVIFFEARYQRKKF